MRHTNLAVEPTRRSGVDLDMGRTTLMCVAIVVATTAAATLAPPQQTPAPLRLSLSCATSPALAFRLTVQNISSEPTAVVIGWILGNDKKYLLAPATLVVTRPGESDVTLTYFDVTVPGIGGRMDPWLVMLPAGASYSVLVPAGNFRSSPDLKQGDFTRPAKVQVHLPTKEIGNRNPDMEGLKFIHVWVGTLTTVWLDVPNQCAP